MKRTLLVLLLAATAVSLFSGCEAMENSKPYDQGGWVGVPN
jgi:hypothetical protein